MSVNGLGLGRCSGALHLAVQFPKVTACLCALGLVVYRASLGSVQLIVVCMPRHKERVVCHTNIEVGGEVCARRLE